MKHFSYCAELRDGWKYTTQEPQEQPFDAYFLTKTGAQTGPHAMSFDDSGWQETSVPHDLTTDAPISPLNNNFNAYVKRPNVWFRRFFFVDEALRGKRILLRFAGVTGVSSFYVNGVQMGMSHSSFCGVELDITDVVRFGGAVNLVSIACDNHRPEGWWYQGTGIYRRVWLVATERLVIDPMSVRMDTVQEEAAWSLNGSFSLLERGYAPKQLRVEAELFAPDGSRAAFWKGEARKETTFHLSVAEPELWDVGAGRLYLCRIALFDGDTPLDCVEKKVGFRSIRFDAEQGFFLNGRRVELRGMCYHEDEGNLGWNIGKEVYEKRLQELLAMGGNAYRCSHNAPAEELLELCDEYGILVMDETRRFDTGEIGLKELSYLVRRDRCHPSIILWSIGNEEPWQGEDRGFRIAAEMRRIIRELDDTRPVTMAMHNGFYQKGAGEAVDVIGVNYNHEDYDKIRARYPDKPFVASEILNLADGVYENGNPYNGTDGALATLKAIAERPYIAGSFGWAGEEYRGEHRNLGFFTDCCPLSCIGERKDAFYHYQAVWTEQPMIHICGHWNHKDGELCRVKVFSNTEEAVLLLNGAEAGRAAVNERKEAEFTVPFAPGTLCAEGFDGGSRTAVDRRVTAAEPVAMRLLPEKTELAADGAARMTIRLCAVDAAGNVTPTGSFFFEAQCTGGARIVCCDNSDPYCTPFPECNTSVMYRGWGKIILESGTEAGTCEITVRSPELGSASCTVTMTAAPCHVVEAVPNLFVNDWFITHAWEKEPDIHEYTEDAHYMKWRKYVEPSFTEADQMPLFDRKGYVIYCMEPNMPAVRPGRVPALVFEGITGSAKILVNMRDYNNTITREYYCEKTEAAWDSTRIELPGAQEGERMIIKLVIRGTEPAAGLAGAVRFEI